MHPSSEVWETGRLIALLDDQHAELEETAARLQDRRGSARLDLFLRFRRLTALHALLEELALVPLLGPGGAGAPHHPVVAPLVSELEGHPTGGRASDWEQVLSQVSRHARECERRARSVPEQPLTEQQSEIAARVCHLWRHEAEVLGSSLSDMLWILRDHLHRLEAADETDVSPEGAYGLCMSPKRVGAGGTHRRRGGGWPRRAAGGPASTTTASYVTPPSTLSGRGGPTGC